MDPPTDATLRYGGRLASALLGVDRHYRSESGDADGLAVLNLARPGELEVEPLDSYPAARRRFEVLLTESARLPEPDRRVYYGQVCRSTLAFIEWRSHGLPFERQLAEFLHVPAEPVPDSELDRIRAAVRALLGGLGYPGDLPAQCAAWETRHRVAAGEVPTVLEDLMRQAWDRTEARLLPIPAVTTDGMRIAPVTGVAFNARCSYPERIVEINTDPVLTRPGLKHLAVHEGCPGHYVQFKLRETMFRAGEAAADVLLSVVNTASSSVFEGIADAGMAMIDWIETDDDGIQALFNRYRSAIGTGAAWRLHALGWPAGRVADWLRAMTLVGGEGWVANRMAFIAAPARAALIWSYWWGEPVVAAAWDEVPPVRRPEFLRFLYGRMHSNSSVGMFA